MNSSEMCRLIEVMTAKSNEVGGKLNEMNFASAAENWVRIEAIINLSTAVVMESFQWIAIFYKQTVRI